MKKIYSILIFCLSAFMLPVFHGCVEEVELVEELNLPACLTPSSTSMSVDRATGNKVTYTWANSKGATRYVVEIFEGAEEDLPETVFETEPVKTDIVPAPESGSNTSRTYDMEADKFYFARVKAQGLEADGLTKAIDDSHWAVFPYPAATYIVKPDVHNITVKERTTTTVTLTWEMPKGDTEVNQVRVSPNPADDGKNYGVYELGETVVTAGGTVEFTVGTADKPLDSSTQYTFAVHYGSANRGEVVAWTRPNWSEAVDAPDVATLKQLIDEAADIPASPDEAAKTKQIRLTNLTDPYSIETLSVYGSVVIFGEEKDGKMPVVDGQFRLKPATADKVGCTSFRLEALDLRTIGTSSLNCIDLTGPDEGTAYTAETPLKIEVLNCRITGYNKSAIYVSKAPVWFSSILFDGCSFEDCRTQQLFDFRIDAPNCGIEKFVIRNSTFSNLPSRGLVRYDKMTEGTLGEFTFEHNTLYKVGGVDPSSDGNAGVFHIQGEVGRFSVTENVFMSIDIPLVSGKSSAVPAVSKNFYYKIGETAWAPEEDGDNKVNEGGLGLLTQSAAIAGGGAVLNSDPCENAERGLFNIKPENAIILDAKAGDPRWLIEYVPEEVPDLTPVAYETTWDLTDVETFYDEIDASTVRGNIEFFVEDNPIKVSDAGMEFTAEASLLSGIPTDCGIAFLVNGAGSVVISTEASRSGTDNDHISVAVGAPDKISAEVVGAVPVGANPARVALPDIEGETLVYIYACGPIVMSGLSWTEEISTSGPTVLDTPANVALTAAEASEGIVTLSWDAVDNAASYTVTITGPSTSDVAVHDGITVTSYELPLTEMTTGVYTLTVQAIAGDALKENSEVSAPVTFEKTESWTTVSSAIPTTWGNADFQYLYETRAGSDKNTEVTADFVYNNLNYLMGGGKCKFGEDTNASDVKSYRYQFGGTGSVTKQALQFKVAGNGTLAVEAASSSAEVRYVCVSVGDNQIIVKGDSKTEDDTNDDDNIWGCLKDKSAKVFTTEVTEITGETVISIYSGGSGINIFSVTWTPEGYDRDAVIVDDGTSVGQFMADFSVEADYPSGAYQEDKVDKNKVHYVGASEKAINYDPSGKRIKFNGTPDFDENGLPEFRYAYFNISGPGTVYFLIRSGNNQDAGRNATVTLKKIINGQVITKELYSDFAKTADQEPIQIQVTKEDLEGTTVPATLYFYSKDNTENLYDLGFTPATE